MKKWMQKVTAVVLIMLLSLGTMTVWANVGVPMPTKVIEVTYGNFRTTLWGNEFAVYNDEGEVLQPFYYNGTVYFPVDAILRAMGTNAQWDEATGTLNFGAPTQPPPAQRSRPLIEAAPHFQVSGNQGLPPVAQTITHTAATGTTIMGGRTHTSALIFTAATWFGSSRRAYHVVHFTSHNLNGEFTTFTGSVGIPDDAALPVHTLINIIGDGRVLFTSNLAVGDLPTSFNINVEGVYLLRLEATFEHVGTYGRTIAFVGDLQ